MNQKKTAFVTKELMLRAVKDSFVKLAPKTQLRNPVMFLVYVSAVLTTALYVCSLFGVADARPGFILAVAVILWFTVLLRRLRRGDRRRARQGAGRRAARRQTGRDRQQNPLPPTAGTRSPASRAPASGRATSSSSAWANRSPPTAR